VAAGHIAMLLSIDVQPVHSLISDIWVPDSDLDENRGRVLLLQQTEKSNTLTGCSTPNRRRNPDLCLGNIHWECFEGVLVFNDVHLHKEYLKVCMLQTQAQQHDACARVPDRSNISQGSALSASFRPDRQISGQGKFCRVRELTDKT
jgi:hypothetical protein